MRIRKHGFDYNLIVIGSGAGGSVGAHYAHSLGKKVAIFEKAEIGGECPNWACVPTKAMLYAAKVYQMSKNSEQFGVSVGEPKVNWDNVRKWRDLVVSRTGASHGEEVFKKEGLHLIKGKAKFVSSHEVESGGKVYSADKFIIATGTIVAIPPITGLEKSGYFTFHEAGELEKLPKSVFILGGGPVGCEFAQIFSTFGSKVIIADSLDKILFREDSEVSNLVRALFENQGIEVLTGIKVLEVEKEERNKIENGRLVVNKYLQTTAPHIFAAGDIVGPYQFTHTGEYQSYIAASNAFTYRKTKPDYSVVPRCVFVDPEVASVGISESEAKENNIKYKVGISATAQIGRANTSNEFDGFVKVITNRKETIIGASIVAPRAGEMIHELALAVKLKAKAKDVAEMIHAYPTFSEAIKFACSSLESR